MKSYTARYVLVDGEFREKTALQVDEHGVVVGFAPATSDSIDLGEVALLPGLVNAHSHSFQRVIRGRTEWLDPARPDEDFWTWRERMYHAAMSLGPDAVYDVARWTFLEMLTSGITTVGEFHYLHHQQDGTPYDDPNELAHQVIAAAREVGIRIVLLRVGYQRGGFEREASPQQRRFTDPDIDTHLRRVGDLISRYGAHEGVSVGLAPHSIRAVDYNWLEASGEAAREWDVPLHIHACEQRRELEESVAEYGRPPVGVFESAGILDERLTLVHATHLSDEEHALLARHRPTVCACPTTERNLGDGFLPATRLVEDGVAICLGSDSQANIDLFEDARLVEYHERLRFERRNVLARAALAREGSGRVSDVLWPMLAAAGARSLRQPVGNLAIGEQADFITLDLRHPTLLGADRASLLADVCLSVSPGAVRDVFVGGRKVVESGEHPQFAEAADAFVARLQAL